MSHQRGGPHHIGTQDAVAGDFLGYDPEVDEYRPMPAVVPSRIVPLTTAVNGVPDLVWDGNNQMVFTEVPSV